MIEDSIARMMRERKEEEARLASLSPEEREQIEREREQFEREIASRPRYNPFACRLCQRVFCRRGCPNWEPLNLPGLDEDGKLLA